MSLLITADCASPQVIFDLTLCGDWAGNTFHSQCAHTGATSCDTYISDPSNMREAYWTVNHVDVWEEKAQPSTIGSSRGEYFGLANRMRPQ